MIDFTEGINSIYEIFCIDRNETDAGDINVLLNVIINRLQQSKNLMSIFCDDLKRQAIRVMKGTWRRGLNAGPNKFEIYYDDLVGSFGSKTTKRLVKLLEYLTAELVEMSRNRQHDKFKLDFAECIVNDVEFYYTLTGKKVSTEKIYSGMDYTMIPVFLFETSSSFPIYVGMYKRTRNYTDKQFIINLIKENTNVLKILNNSTEALKFQIIDQSNELQDLDEYDSVESCTTISYDNATISITKEDNKPSEREICVETIRSLLNMD
jgi:hypothetical protein